MKFEVFSYRYQLSSIAHRVTSIEYCAFRTFVKLNLHIYRQSTVIHNEKSSNQRFLFLISAFIINHSLAQENSSNHKKDLPYQPSDHIRAGAIFGINAAQVDGDDFAGYHKVGINTGFYAQIPVWKYFFVSTEILYSQRGAKSPTIQGQPLEYQINLNYAEVPLLFHFQDKKAFNIGAGVAYARLLKEAEWYMQEPNPPIQTCMGKPTNPSTLDPHFVCLRKNDYSVVAEGNYLPLSHLAINVRFAYSIAPFGYRGASNFINRGMYHNLLSFRLMWIFGS